MAHINLLPWRQELRKERQRQFLTIMGLSAMLMALIVVAVHLQYSRMIAVQESRNQVLSKYIEDVDAQLAEIKDLDQQIERLKTRMQVIERLQANRPEVVRLFNELAESLPDGVYLTKLKQSGNTLTLEGEAQSQTRVSSFMRSLDAAKSMANPSLEVIEVDPKSPEKARRFVLRVTQVIPEAGENKKSKLQARK